MTNDPLRCGLMLENPGFFKNQGLGSDASGSRFDPFLGLRSTGMGLGDAQKVFFTGSPNFWTYKQFE